LIDLKKSFGDRYRIRWDESRKAGGWTKEDFPYLMQIVGRHGFISLWKADSLAAVCIGKTQSRKFGLSGGIDLRLPRTEHTPRPGWRLLQWSEFEVRLSFPTDELDAVAKMLGCTKRSPSTPEGRERLAALRGRRALALVESM
jgi:hypothetical protein